MLALVAILTLIATRDVTQLWWIALLAVAGLPALLAPQHGLIGPLGRVAEVVVVGLAASEVAAVASIGGTVDGLGASAVLPYLAAPVIVTALRRRFAEGGALLAVAGATLLISGALTEVGGERQLSQVGYLAVCAQWLILAALGLYAAGALHRIIAVRAENKPQPYAEATRLLTQLRTVARQLPGATLDPGGISEHLLDELRTVAPADRGAVLSASGGGRLVVLAQAGVDRWTGRRPSTRIRRSPTPGPASRRRPPRGRSRARTGAVTSPRLSSRWWQAYARSGSWCWRPTPRRRTRPLWCPG